MNWPPDIADELPAPRDDEPPSLRQDIADELADHLQCAHTRELHLSRDEQSAQENAIGRFGDPRAIARKLWFDALRDKIMSQRLTVAALILVTFVSIGSAGATWLLVDQVKKSNEALLAHSQEQNTALIAKLAELAAAPRTASEPTLPPEWNSVRCRLVAGDKPAPGFEVAIVGRLLDPSREIVVKRVTDAAGIADFGLIRAGQHRLTVRAPWGDQREDSPITVFPGKGVIEEVSCPASRPAKSDVTFRVDWPNDLKEQGFWAVAHFKAEPVRIEGSKWLSSNREDECVVVLPPDGPATLFPVTGVLRYRPGEQQMWPFESNSSSARGFRPGDALGLSKGTAERWLLRYRFFTGSNDVEAPVRCEAGDYRLTSLLVMKPSGTGAGGDQSMNAFTVIGGLIPGATLSAEEQTQKAMIKKFFTPLEDWVNVSELLKPTDSNGAGLSIPQVAELRRESQPAYVASDKQKNEWTISLPPRLLEKVRTNPEISLTSPVVEPLQGEQNSD